MKITIRYISLIIFNVLFFNNVVLAQGVSFNKISLKEAVDMAVSTNKIVFVDCATSWCGSCKIMDSEVFTQQAAGDYFDKKFISIKLDMEQGEGVEFAKKYNVNRYPTFILLDTLKNEICRLIGYKELSVFLKCLDYCLESGENVSELGELYSVNKISKQQMLRYWYLLLSDGASMGSKSEGVGRQLYSILTDEDKMQADYWHIVEHAAKDIKSPATQFIKDNMEKISRNIGKQRVNDFLFSKYIQYFSDISYWSNADTSNINIFAQEMVNLNIVEQQLADNILAITRLSLSDNFNLFFDKLDHNFKLLPLDLTQMYILVLANKAKNRDSKNRYSKISHLCEAVADRCSSPFFKSSMLRMAESYKKVSEKY